MKQNGNAGFDANGRPLIAKNAKSIRVGHSIAPPQMPSIKGKFTSAEIDDLVTYLESLRFSEN